MNECGKSLFKKKTTRHVKYLECNLWDNKIRLLDFINIVICQECPIMSLFIDQLWNENGKNVKMNYFAKI